MNSKNIQIAMKEDVQDAKCHGRITQTCEYKKHEQ